MPPPPPSEPSYQYHGVSLGHNNSTQEQWQVVQDAWNKPHAKKRKTQRKCS